MVRRARASLPTLPHRALPLALLAAVSLLSLGARLAWIAQPCHAPCRSASDHVLVFDESYYVNAARVIAGVHPPPNQPYADAPPGTDPNGEHPQLAKLIIAGSIELFGDDPFAWRIGSIVLGSLAILGMFALARAAGAEPWGAVAAAALMAFDNLLLVHGRIGTLDIYAVAAMIWGVTAYLRGRPLLAGVVLGIGACSKLVAPYALVALVVLEALRGGWGPGELRRRAGRLATCAVASAAVFLALLTVMGRVASPYDATAGRRIDGGPFAHLSHMLSYAASQSSPHGPTGIASYPWQWLGDYRPIVYLNINPSQPAPGLTGVHPASHFLGMISPPVLLVGLLALGLAVARVVAPRRRGPARELERAGVAWVIGTLVPFELLSLIWARTSYLYYMVVVMPGLYLLGGELVARAAAGRRRRVLIGWSVTVLAAAVVMYPFTPLP